MPLVRFSTQMFSCSVRASMLRGLMVAALGATLTATTVFAHGTYHARLTELNARLALAPDDAALLFNLAELHSEHEEPDKALPVLEQVAALAPGKFPVDYLRSRCLLQAGRPHEALASLNLFVSAQPDNAAGHVQRARALAAEGRQDLSLADYRTALRLSPRPEPDLVQEAADALAAAGHQDEAMQVLDAGLLKTGPIPSLMLRALEWETASGHYDDALSRVDLLQKSAPRPEPWMARRATILAQAGRRAEARAAWEALLARIAGLPNLERGSHAISRIAEQAHQALANLPEAS